MGKRRRRTGPDVRPAVSEKWVWLALAVIVVCYAAIRIRLLSMPLERDEGEYTYTGQLILQGIPPFTLSYNMKAPGIYYAYALVMALFGQNVIGIHVGLLLVNAGAVILLFLIARRLFDSTVGLVSAAAYGFLTINAQILGTQAHATHFVVLPALGGILCAMTAVERRGLKFLIWSGLLLGLAFTMKQHGVFFVLFTLLYLLWNDISRRRADRNVRLASIVSRTSAFVVSAAVPWLLICGVLVAAGVFRSFWFWMVDYAREYVSEVPAGLGLVYGYQNTVMMLTPSWPIWAFAAAGLVLVWVDGLSRRRAAWVTGFFGCSFLTICPGFFFREHYYVTWMPAIALLVGVAVGAGRNVLWRASRRGFVSRLPAGAFAVALMVTVFVPLQPRSALAHSDFLFHAPPRTASRMMYGTNPWVESQAIAAYIREHSRPTDTIAVLGSEPQIYFYADRKSATGYVYTYALMEPQRFARTMQAEMIRQIETSRPKFLVVVVMPSSWLAGADSDRTIFDWQVAYTSRNYDLVGVAYPRRSGPEYYDVEPVYSWGAEARAFRPQPGQEVLYVFERKPR